MSTLSSGSSIFESPQALDYLLGRGLTTATIERFRLGWDAKRRAIVIPYINAMGEIRRLRYRNLDPNANTKYIWGDGEKGAHLFFVRNTRKEQLWLTEGEFDAMILSQLGYPAVAVPGAKLFKREWRYLFAYTKTLTAIFDNDVKADGTNPGQEGASRVAGILGAMVAEYRNVKLPPGKDVTDLYLEDRNALEELIR